MNRPSTGKTLGAVALAGVVIAGCASLNPFKEPDQRWAEYKTWTRVTADKVSTGPSAFLGAVHKGPEGYREVYVNDIGKEALEGAGPYTFPAGTVIVKEQYSNEAAWESGKGAEVTVSLKMTNDESAGVDNWLWAAGYTGTAEKSNFCSGCHTAANSPAHKGGDWVFTTADFLAEE